MLSQYKKLETESDVDADRKKIRQAVKSGDWSQCCTSIKASRNEISINGKIVLRGTQIVIPKILQMKVILLAHEGHKEIVKPKARLRSKVWWLGMDQMAENVCRSCRHKCQLVSQPSYPVPMTRTELPEGPWKYKTTDLLGPLPNCDFLPVVIDYYSRYFITVGGT